MSCVFKHKESKINTLSELREQGILDGPYLKDNKENEFNNYHNSLVESVQENYNLGINKFFNVLEQRTSSAFGISKKFVQPIDSSFKQLDQARKDLGIYDSKESYLSFKEASEAKSIKLNEVTNDYLNKTISVNNLFNENPQFASEIYEALGFKQTITQDNKSYYRGQLEPFKLDSNGNLILEPKYAGWQEEISYDKYKGMGISLSPNLSVSNAQANMFYEGKLSRPEDEGWMDERDSEDWSTRTIDEGYYDTQ